VKKKCNGAGDTFICAMQLFSSDVYEILNNIFDNGSLYYERNIIFTHLQFFYVSVMTLRRVYVCRDLCNPVGGGGGYLY
jgi:hypothetical protein